MNAIRTLILGGVFATLNVCAYADIELQPTNVRNTNNDSVVVNNIDSRKEVAYICKGAENQTVSLTAMYGIKDGEVVVAQVRLGGVTSPGLWRVPDTLLNRFQSNEAGVRPTMWTAFPATSTNVDRVDGGKLSYSDTPDGVQTIIVNNCKLDKSATDKLNR